MTRTASARLWPAGLALLVVLAALTLGIRFGPAVTLSLALALPATEAWLAPFLQDVVREEITLVTDGRQLRADLYRPGAPRAALLLVHGLSPAGRRHPELARLAGLLARHGSLVLVPELEGLVAFRLSGAEVEEIRSAVHHLAARSAVVGIAGFSFGAGPALLAAAELPDVRLVASFGGYAELAHVVAYISTGVHAFGGRRYVQPPEEYNRWKLLALLAGLVENARDRELLASVADQKLRYPAADTAALEGNLGGEGRSVLALALNRREDRLEALLRDLPPRVREALARLSPLAAVPRIRGRLLIAHGAADESIPFTESLRLAAVAGGRARVVLLRSFHHTGPRPFWQSLRERGEDAWNLLGLADELIHLN